MTDIIDSLHEDLAALTRRFADAIDAILLDIQGPRGPFEDAAGRFIEAYRAHMNKEERELLPAARRALGAADWAEIDARLSQPEDRLFGAPSEERFAETRGQETRGQYTGNTGTVYCFYEGGLRCHVR